MRVWGQDSLGDWVQVNTDSNGSNSYVYLTALAQVLKMVQNESPFYSQFGIPAYQSVLSQVAPDSAISRTQLQYSQYFALLNISKTKSVPPTYAVYGVFLDGTPFNITLAI